VGVALETAVKAIENDLSDRSGIGWDSIDEETKEEIREKWREIMLRLLSIRP
jgi:hypothetical protein